MIDGNQADPITTSLTRPLCRSYGFAIHERLIIQVLDGIHARGKAIHWALGVLADGSSELLGVWAVPDSGSWTWQNAVEALKARGVEKIGLESHLGFRPSFAISLRRAHTLRLGEEAMHQMKRRARRAIRLREPFFDIADATYFVERVLSRAELELDSTGASFEKAARDVADTRQTRNLNSSTSAAISD